MSINSIPASGKKDPNAIQKNNVLQLHLKTRQICHQIKSQLLVKTKKISFRQWSAFYVKIKHKV